MKIIQIVCTFPPYKGGMGNVAYRYALIAKENGKESLVLTPKYKKGEEEYPSFFALKRLKSFLRYGNAALLLQIGKYIKDDDIVHFHYPFFGTDLVLWFLKVVLKKEFKLVIHYHMDVIGLAWYLQPLTWPSKLVFPSLIKKTDLVTCGSLDYVKNSDMKNVYKKYQDKFKELNFGVDIDHFYPVSKNKEHSGLSFLFVGGLDQAHYFKGLDFLFNALSCFRDRDWILNIVGSGNLLERYKGKVENLNLSNKIRFLGKVSHEKLPGVYANSDLFILPSINKNEAFGLVLLEAMASGVAVLSSNLPGVRTVFNHKKEGVYFKTNDFNDFKKRMDWIFNNELYLRNMGKQGRILVESKYDWKKIAINLNKLYENLSLK